MEKPNRIEPSLVESVDKYKAARPYNAALRIIKLWHKKADAPPDILAKFSECEIA
jgi:hypothetical protein